MELYLVQHGEAKPETEDPARPLTDRGQAVVHRVGRHAACLSLQIAEIRHSGKLRARQTAEILAGYLSPPGGVREAEGMAPNDDPGMVRTLMQAAQESLMLVGHLPHLTRLASSLLLGDPAREIIRFRMGAIVCLSKIEGRWLLQWILTPDLARPKA
jgi:phosphohistidine phosphatase